MTEAAEQLKPTLAALTQEERLSLADWIYESVDAGVDREFLAELERRRAEHENGLDLGVPSADVFASLRRESM